MGTGQEGSASYKEAEERKMKETIREHTKNAIESVRELRTEMEKRNKKTRRRIKKKREQLNLLDTTTTKEESTEAYSNRLITKYCDEANNMLENFVTAMKKKKYTNDTIS